MYVLRSVLVWILVVGSARCSVLNIPDYDSASVTFGVEEQATCNAVRECLNCKTSKLCIPGNDGFKQVALISCDSNPGTPYCDYDTGLCTSVAPNGCDSLDFVCPSANGTYPDPGSCTRYHICVNGVRRTNVCPTNNVYDHALGECKLRRSSADCVVTNCQGQEGKTFVYAKDDRIYGTCVNGKPYLVGRCRDYEKYDLTLGRCIRVCRGPGTQPTEACQKYIRCAQTSWNKYEPVLQYCACDKGYDEETGACTPDVDCIKSVKEPCKLKPFLQVAPHIFTEEDEAEEDSSDESSNESSNESSDESSDDSSSDEDQELSPFIINNSDNQHSKNEVSNGNDTNNGNIVNGNGNGNNSNSGNVGNTKSRSEVFIINNSGNSGSNDVSNGDDSNNGNIVNGNGNSNNSNGGDVGNVAPARPGFRPFIINNSDNKGSSNNVSNGDDSNNGNIINGNGNSDNSNGGNVGNVIPPRPGVRPYIINNSENGYGKNEVSNGDDSNNGNIVNGNGNSNNENKGDVGNVAPARPGVRPYIINNSDNKGSSNNVSNGDDSNNGNIINGNGNSDNSNGGDVGNVVPARPGVRPYIINNSENDYGKNEVSNGDDSNNGNIVNGNGNSNNANEGDVGNVAPARPGVRPYIINNSDNKGSSNNVSNGDDSNNGNIINGNGNSDNSNGGDVGNVVPARPGVRPYIINNSENGYGKNEVSNGDDSNNGNLVNGNGNSNNENKGDVGNVAPARPGFRPFIINNSDNKGSSNNVSNGDDSHNGNIINGNGNSDNSNEGDVGNVVPARPGFRPFIINNSDNKGSSNNVSNGDDSNNGNIVNGNGNSNNGNEGDVGNVVPARPGVRPYIINNSDNGYGKNEVSNGDDSNNGNIVNGNGNSNNENKGDVGNVAPARPGFRPFIINNSDNKGSSNNVSNGDDSHNGNIINGNGNSNNGNEGDVGNVVPARPGVRPYIINNSDNGYGKNEVSNGDDSNNGNIVNGNGNSNNANEGDVGNVVPARPGFRPFIINNSDNKGSSNNVSNGDDSNNGNIINGNGNSGNSNGGNVANH